MRRPHDTGSRARSARRSGRLAGAVWLVLAVLWPLAAAAQEESYLADQALFDAAWSTFRETTGHDLDLMTVRITAKRIEVEARSATGGARADSWTIERNWGLFGTRDAVSGPRPVRPSGPVADLETAFFPAADLPLARLAEILATAAARAPLQTPGAVTEVRIARQVTLIPAPAHGDVRWRITIANDRERAVAEAGVDGTVIGLDISGTHRGRTRDFLAQADWPFGDAQSGFARLVGEAATVYRIDVTRRSIAVTATSGRSARDVTRWSWDGGRFTRGLIDLPNFETALPSGDLPYALGEVDLALVPRIARTALAKAPGSGFSIVRMEAVKEPVAAGRPEVLWRVALGDGTGGTFARDDDRVQVRVRPDGTVASVVLPARLRPAVDYLSPDGVAEAIARFRVAFGAGHQVFELRFETDEARLKHRDTQDPRAVATAVLSGRGLTRGTTSPRIMEADADLFALSRLEGFDAAAAGRMIADALAALAIPGAGVYRIQISSGGPFQRPPSGEPVVTIRARAAAGDGYARFLLSGKLLDAVK